MNHGPLVQTWFMWTMELKINPYNLWTIFALKLSFLVHRLNEISIIHKNHVNQWTMVHLLPKRRKFFLMKFQIGTNTWNHVISREINDHYLVLWAFQRYLHFSTSTLLSNFIPLRAVVAKNRASQKMTFTNYQVS